MNMVWTEFQSTNNQFVLLSYSKERLLTSLFKDNIPKYITSVFRRELEMVVTLAKAMAIPIEFHLIPPVFEKLHAARKFVCERIVAYPPVS